MPFKIIRNDITKVKADVIVNTANPKPIFASGTDKAIYQAAGADEVLAERIRIGDIKRGDVAVTNAYRLDAKYIIHTVGPAWIDGEHHEFDILESCYRKSLNKAQELGAKSIAFPLIATGVYGFPKDKALQIEMSVFSRFLVDNEMEIILVVFDKKSFCLSERVVGAIDSYIDSQLVAKKQSAEYSDRGSRIEQVIMEPSIYMECSSASSVSLEEELENIGPSFHEKLFEIIAVKGFDNTQVWKQSNLDHKHFSKIQCNEKYHPNKKTVMALCIGLQLDIDQAKDLMARADWAFSPSSKMDLIVQKAILDKNYDMMELNTVLFSYTNEILGV